MARGNGWYQAKRRDLVTRRGGKCERCGAAGPFEFHHLKSTGLYGRGRGQNHRVLDILRHPKAYVMLCAACHRLAHAEDV